MQRSDNINSFRQIRVLRGPCHRQINKLHARIKTKLFRQGVRLVDQFLPGLHTSHYSPFRVLF